MSQRLPRLVISMLISVLVAVQAAPSVPTAELPMQDRLTSVSWEQAKAELALDAEQDELWRRALNASRQAVEVQRQDQQKLVSLMPGQTADVDFGALDLQIERLQQAGRDARGRACEQWLALYDSLSPDQRRVADVYLRQVMGSMGRLSPGYAAVVSRAAGSAAAST